MEYRIFGITQLSGQKFKFPLEEKTHYTRQILNKKGNNNPEIFKFLQNPDDCLRKFKFQHWRKASFYKITNFIIRFCPMINILN